MSDSPESGNNDIVIDISEPEGEDPKLYTDTSAVCIDDEDEISRLLLAGELAERGAFGHNSPEAIRRRKKNASRVAVFRVAAIMLLGGIIGASGTYYLLDKDRVTSELVACSEGVELGQYVGEMRGIIIGLVAARVPDSEIAKLVQKKVSSDPRYSFVTGEFISNIIQQAKTVDL